MPRHARNAPGGLVYHALNRANGRLPLFDSAADYAAFEKCLAEAAARVPGARLLAYVVMPNHWHLVLWPRGDGELSEFMRVLTLTHAQRWHAHRKSAGAGHVYQGRFKSFPVQRDGHLVALCRYVERNALRARLVRAAQNWRWCSLWRRESTRTRAGAASDAAAVADRLRPPLHEPWPVDRPPPAAWLARVNGPQTAAEEQAVRTSLARSRPLGSAAWVDKTAGDLGLQWTTRPRGRPRKHPRDVAKAGPTPERRPARGKPAAPRGRADD